MNSLADALLGRAADVVFILDSTTGTATARWYDPAVSRLDLSAVDGEQKLVSLIHPDDLPEVLEAYANVVGGEENMACFARIAPDQEPVGGRMLLVSLRRIDDLTDNGVLVLAWVIEADGVVQGRTDEVTSLSSLAAAAPVGLQVRSSSGRVSFENARFTELVDGARDDVDLAVDEAAQSARRITRDLSSADRAMRMRVVPTVDDQGRLLHTVVSLEDVTREQQAEAARFLAEEQFGALFESSPMATALVGLDGSIIRVNEPFAVVTGYDIEALVGMKFQTITHPDDLVADEQLLGEVLDGTRRNYQMEKRYAHAAGYDVWVELTVAPVRGADGSVELLVAHVEDITSRRTMLDFDNTDDAGEALTYWATHDHLTALPNRRYLDSHLDLCLTHARDGRDRPVVLFVDLDDFKPVNDGHGHHVGDEVLRTTGRRLRNACRDDDLVARYGGDEFVIVARNLRRVDDVPLLVERIANAVQAPIDLDGGDVRIGASIGIAVARDGDDVPRLLHRADAACYRAKRAGKNQASFSIDA